MPSIVLIAIIGLVGGVLSGLFGIGGGLVIVPALVLLAGFPIALAAGTSLAALLLPVGLFGAIEYFRAGNVDVRAAAVIAFGLLLGAYFGARLGTSLPPQMVQRAFGVFLLVVGARLTLFA
jgi:uncharacterized membrane protein YfcA